MRTKLAFVAAFTAATVVALSACSGTSSGGDTNASGGQITIWDMENTPQRIAAFNKLADDYNATNPQYKVSFEVQDWGQIYSKIASAVQAKSTPDVLFATADFTTYVRNLGVGEPVTGIVDDLGKQHPFIDAATAPYTDGGQTYAIPLYGMVQVLWYRKDKFQAAGITGAPKTWSELLADAKTLTQGSTYGIAVPAGKNEATDQVAYSFMVTGGDANIFNADGSVNFDTPATVDAFSYYQQLLQYSPKDSGNYAWAEPQAAFNSGSAAMAIEKGQYLSPWQKESGLAPDQLGCAPIPVKDDGGKPGSIYYSNGAMVLTKDSAKQQGIEDFFSWVLSDQHYGDFLNAEPGLFLPVTQDAAKNSNWRDNAVLKEYPDCVDVLLDQSKTGELFGFVGGQYIPRLGDIAGQNIIAQTVQKIYVDGQSPQDAVTWGQSQMEAAIK